MYSLVVIFTGMIIAFCLIIDKLPEGITFSKALNIAGASGKMEVLYFSFNLVVTSTNKALMIF